MSKWTCGDNAAGQEDEWEDITTENIATIANYVKKFGHNNQPQIPPPAVHHGAKCMILVRWG
jgi:hypothetical protein